MKVRDLRTAPSAVTISLGEPKDSLTAAASKNNASTVENLMGKPLQIGFGREVAQTATASATNQVLKWQPTGSGGQIAAINFSSTGAKGMRIGLLISQLPTSAILRFYSNTDTSAFEVKGDEILAVIAKNVASGDTSNDARTYWSPVIKSNNGTIEIEIPAKVDANKVQISIPIVSHFFISMNDAQKISALNTYDANDPSRTGNAGKTCQVDVKCTDPLPAASDAVAWLVFNQSAGSASICSGTLLNDNLNSRTPYLLTANHCISSQTSASTLYTDFKYRSLTCNNSTTGEYFPTTTTGSALLYTAYSTDTTLLRLYGAPSTEVLFAGWDATTAPATATTGIHGIHHPRGDQQRLSRGSISGYFTRNPTNTNSFLNSDITNGTILNVTLANGIVEGGSSGSAIFKGTDANPQVIGQLFGGQESACNTLNPTVSEPQFTVYGRFDVAFRAGMSDWLVQGIKPVTQFYNSSTSVHYYSFGVTNNRLFSASNPTYINQGNSFNVSSYQTAGLSPVYRFFNTVNGTYFYTISEKERAAVASNTTRMRYDGIVWYASATAAVGTVPLYSAFNTVTGSQYFTTSSATRSSLIAANPQFITDGIAFHVTP
jgi:lysyl endopeptidase